MVAPMPPIMAIEMSRSDSPVPKKRARQGDLVNHSGQQAAAKSGNGASQDEGAQLGSRRANAIGRRGIGIVPQSPYGPAKAAAMDAGYRDQHHGQDPE